MVAVRALHVVRTLWLPLLLAAGLATGCASVTVTRTEPTAIEQELVVRALERAVAQLDTRSFVGRRVAFALYGLTKDEAFAREFVAARLRARGIQVVDSGSKVDVRLTAFASIIGIDQGDTLIGIPALQVPVVSIPIPEIALFKWSRSRGHSELQLFAFDPETGRLLERVPDGVGRSKYDRYTVLLVFGFTDDDLNSRPRGEPPVRPED
jgi:hypothetical protein